MSADLSNPIFHDEEAARKWLEARVWPNGPVCPHCKEENRATLMRAKQLALAFTNATLAVSLSRSRSERSMSARKCRSTHGLPSPTS